MTVGTRLLPSRYEDPRQIAAGGMGQIYLAHDATLDRKVAVKVLDEQFSRDEELRRRFTREALAAARLSGHPHIVTIFDVGECAGRPFIVMEYLGGGTLAERGRSGSISHADSVAWLTEAADALDEAHRHGIVHRDVKPANLLFDDRGTLKVVDFGIARVVDETTSGMTIAGTVLGTAGYLSPEQARGEPATPASDIYGLGIVAYELLTGGRPFAGGTATEEAAAHLHQPVPPASERGVGLSHEVDRVLERALAKDPGERYGSATAFVEGLQPALDGTGHTKIQPAAAIVPPTAATRPVTRDEPRREPAPVARSTGSRRPWLPLAVGILLALCALAGFALATTVGDGDGTKATDKKRTTPAAAPAEATTSEITVTETLPGTTVQETVTVETPPAADNGGGNGNASGGSGAGSVSMAEARSLTDEATYALRRGDYERAYALAAEALDRRLRGTGDIYEAYASYDAGAALARLGQCDDALALLDRSEAIQGHRTEIDQARARCS